MARIERWIIYPVLALLTWAAFAQGVRIDVRSAVAGEPLAPVAELVTARAFTLVDAEGRGRARLYAAPAWTVLSMQDNRGESRLMITVGEDGMPRMAMKDAALKERLVFALGGDGRPVVSLHDASEQVRVLLSLDGDGFPSLSMLDANKNLRVALDVGDHGYPALNLFGANKKLRVALALNETEEPSLELLDAGGKPRIVLGSAPLINKRSGLESDTTPSSIVLFDKDGKVVWRAPPR